MTNTDLSFATVIEKLPSFFVVVAFEVFFSIIVAPGKASPLSLTTLPDIVIGGDTDSVIISGFATNTISFSFITIILLKMVYVNG